MDIQEIGKRIKQARTLRNYTLDDIANEIGVAKSTIQRYENALIGKPKIPVLQAIADSLKVNPAWLSGKDVPMEIETFEQKWDREVKEFFDKTNAFEAQLKSLGWSYEHYGCHWWYEYNDLGLRPNDEGQLTEDGTGTLVGCGGKKCMDCNEREQFYLFSNGKISFKVNPNDYSSFINDSQSFFKERLQQLLKKSMKQMFIDSSQGLKAAHNDNAADPEQQRLMAEDIADMEDNW